MARPPKKTYNLQEKLAKIKTAGLVHPPASAPAADEPETELLTERIRRILHLVRATTLNATEMMYLVMYDIEDNRVRTHIAKYLLTKGCIRIQKSVYLARTTATIFEEINATLADVQTAYDNHDSILLVPVQVANVSSMKIIGKDIQLQTLVDPPNTLFF
ncbi:MAG: CRISPR-associated endonuclease Cas2 [Bacteroidetes bacterium]|nr:MAG: CRISPR-associated endonuclease Cas2 [Bacteroidota bacterium]